MAWATADNLTRVRKQEWHFSPAWGTAMTLAHLGMLQTVHHEPWIHSDASLYYCYAIADVCQRSDSIFMERSTISSTGHHQQQCLASTNCLLCSGRSHGGTVQPHELHRIDQVRCGSLVQTDVPTLQLTELLAAAAEAGRVQGNMSFARISLYFEHGEAEYAACSINWMKYIQHACSWLH